MLVESLLRDPFVEHDVPNCLCPPTVCKVLLAKTPTGSAHSFLARAARPENENSEGA